MKFASEYLKLTENIFDVKKTKKLYSTTTPSFSFTCHYAIFDLPLNGRGLAGFGEDKGWIQIHAAQLTNNVMSLSLGFSIW